MKKRTSILILCASVGAFSVVGCRQSPAQEELPHIPGADVYRFVSSFESELMDQDGKAEQMDNTFAGSLIIHSSSNHFREVTLDSRSSKAWDPSLRSRMEYGAKGVPPVEEQVCGKIDSSGRMTWEGEECVGFMRDLQVLLGLHRCLTNVPTKIVATPIAGFWRPSWTGTLVMTRSKPERPISYEMHLLAAAPSSRQVTKANGTVEIDPNRRIILNATLDTQEQCGSKITSGKQTVSFDITTRRTTSLELQRP
jgi:hypothetical protein